MTTATHAQIRVLKAAQRALGIDQDTWCEMLQRGYQVASCTLLTEQQADELTDRLVAEARHQGVWTRSKTNQPRRNRARKKYDELGMRVGMATPAQLRLIEVKWADVSRYSDPRKVADALAAFIEKRFRKGGLLALKGTDVSRVVRALDAMKRQSSR